MTDEALIRALNDAYADAVNRRDADAWGALWASDAVWILMGWEFRGRPAIVQAWNEAMAGFAFVGFFCQTGWVEVQGDMAQGRVWTHEVLERRDGSVSTPLGRYDDDYVRTDGRWRFHRRVFHVRRP
ncbi:MAG: nuclear transport factor 2 family protein [Sphingomonadaceae bacterium]|uniref:nuclear transport factor 2 family protein n=1 Tax=Thermaurantiacus sp. TaxID=2820283 RepID=UPI00298F1D3B|nr:nuclear transport factor 2 family protein [Thermaurantiacus sp.]MCS6986221.1 nuclear transport factor 2 family protein [Sphingomonadaceae bacterium]MDW8415878.1 nuclear transport factor 2 family protein [Thermaurantiacus sp.]